MPYKFETTKRKIPKQFDKRYKLTDEQKSEIKKLYGKSSQRKLASKYGVSRRTIQFIGCPEKKEKDLENRKMRGGSKIYYDRKTHTKNMRKYRRRKRELELAGIL